MDIFKFEPGDVVRYKAMLYMDECEKCQYETRYYLVLERIFKRVEDGYRVLQFKNGEAVNYTELIYKGRFDTNGELIGHIDFSIFEESSRLEC